MTGTPDGGGLDPRVERSRAVILPTATEHFLRNGYVGANVDEIAARARVSKRTIYNLFGGKEQLFREILAVALDTAERFSRDMSTALGTTDDVEAELRDLGTKLAGTVLTGPIVRLRRLLIGEAERFPELAGDYYERAPGRVMATLAEGLRRCHERGTLRVGDSELAAEHFAFLVVGASLDRALFEAATPPAAAEVEKRAHAGIDAFLRAYR
ncbi:transcriptional regulator, TetR family [Actinokineospora alba]|uniref:Transcriptional regulator, TetR family n=1 Tax=Actinokineospora alba TaxID=504798 RepID=A0A1H0LKM7_9PSEU|nr:TetR/AcrR family transcriptional regulator [Actinokineospora alba]TDP67362.1 TetR family transcriptional regulator [Actinokineospora alba]SDI98789.1 TetR/AcrR family transcriptional regulator, mexJK operon transcriptional repressor [Actinokineospora alba]SDO68759.1 transcriptional regulator, TetR family [Actinokineospora alba]